jgi:HAD superfamily hydrolase (TIGR01509 family)
MIRAILFDVDGTLAETEEMHRLAFNQEFAARGLDWHWTPSLYRDLLRVAGGKERIAYYLRQWQEVDPADWTDRIADIHAGKTRRYAALVEAGHLGLRDGIRALVSDASRKGCRLAIASTTSRPNIDALSLACFGIEAAELFAVIAAGDEVAAKKPAPDVYRLALDRLGLPASDCIAIEDSRNGLLAAKAAGLRCVVAPSFYSAGDDVAAADLLLPDFTPIGAMAALEAMLRL